MDVIIERGIPNDEREVLELLHRRGQRAKGAVTVQSSQTPRKVPSCRGKLLSLSPSIFHPHHFISFLQIVLLHLAIPPEYSIHQPTKYHLSKSVKMVKAGKTASALLPRHCVKLCIKARASKRKEGSVLPLPKRVVPCHLAHLDGLLQPIMSTVMDLFLHPEVTSNLSCSHQGQSTACLKVQSLKTLGRMVVLGCILLSILYSPYPAG